MKIHMKWSWILSLIFVAGFLLDFRWAQGRCGDWNEPRVGFSSKTEVVWDPDLGAVVGLGHPNSG